MSTTNPHRSIEELEAVFKNSTRPVRPTDLLSFLCPITRELDALLPSLVQQDLEGDQPVLVLTSSGRVVVDSTEGAKFIYAPPIEDGPQSALEVVIATGINPVTILPAPGTTDGVAGSAGSTLVLDPVAGDKSVTLYPDATRRIWQL